VFKVALPAIEIGGLDVNERTTDNRPTNSNKQLIKTDYTRAFKAGPKLMNCFLERYFVFTLHVE
jgi:hypothetical protein